MKLKAAPIYLIVGIVLMGILSSGQKAIAQDKKIGFGLQAIPALTWMKPDVTYIENAGIRANLSYGLMFDFRFGENYSLTSGLNIIGSGGKVKFNEKIVGSDTTIMEFQLKERLDTLPGGTTVTYKLGYVELPIMLLLKTNEIGYITYFGQFGFATQMRIKAKADADAKQITNEDIKKEVRFFNVGLLMGAGIEYSLGGNTALVLGILYNWGLVNVIKEDDKVSQNSLGLRVGVMF